MGAKWFTASHPEMLVTCNLLPISLCCQILDLLQLSKICHKDTSVPFLCDASYNKRARVYTFELPEVRTEKYRTEFCLSCETRRVVNHLPSYKFGNFTCQNTTETTRAYGCLLAIAKCTGTLGAHWVYRRDQSSLLGILDNLNKNNNKRILLFQKIEKLFYEMVDTFQAINCPLENRMII